MAPQGVISEHGRASPHDLLSQGHPSQCSCRGSLGQWSSNPSPDRLSRLGQRVRACRGDQRMSLVRPKLANASTYRFMVVDLLRQRDGDMCWLCGQFVDDGRDASVEHAVPKSRGGRNTAENLRLTHIHCNLTRPRGKRMVWFTRISNLTPCQIGDKV